MGDRAEPAGGTRTRQRLTVRLERNKARRKEGPRCPRVAGIHSELLAVAVPVAIPWRRAEPPEEAEADRPKGTRSACPPSLTLASEWRNTDVVPEQKRARAMRDGPVSVL